MARTIRVRSSALVLAASVTAVGTVTEAEELDRTPTRCVMANRINRDVAVNTRTILFFMDGNRIYRNDLPSDCATLAPGETEIVYHYRTQSVKLTRFCDYDSITVENKPGLHCAIGSFHPITAAEADALVGTPSNAVDATEPTDVAAPQSSGPPTDRSTEDRSRRRAHQRRQD